MNERIRELANQAGLFTDLNGNLWPRAMSAEESIEAYNKFSELIVAECSAVVASVPPCYGDYRDQIEVGMRDHCARVILDHFELK